MKSAIVALAAAAGSAYAQQSAYGQCGGIAFTGETSCVSGFTCQSQNPYYYQCVAGTATAAPSASFSMSYHHTNYNHSRPYFGHGTGTGSVTVTSLTDTVAESTTAVVAPISASSAACSVTYVTVSKSTDSSSAAAPATTSTLATVASSSATSAVSSTEAATSVAASSSTLASSSAAAPSSSSVAVSSVVSSSVALPVASSSAVASSASSAASASSTASASGLKYAGINIAGFDFGCGTDGTCTEGSTDPPGATGNSQMSHFVTDDGLNAFRLPVAWQYLVNWELGGTLDATNFATYNELVQNCTAIASMCIVDVHNYARWDGDVIGQSSGSVTNAQFSSLWSQLATKFADQPKVAFGIMNEPHDITDMTLWGETVQAAVTAIRTAGATSQTILLPGTAYTTANGYATNSGPYLSNITNLDGGFDNLVFDIHAYLDSDNSGTNAACSQNNVNYFEPITTWLKSFTPARQAFLSETGGGPTGSECSTYLCQELQYLADNSDVYLGYTGWAAGMFATSYVLSETPTGSPGAYTDQALVTQCIVGVFAGTYKGGDGLTKMMM